MGQVVDLDVRNDADLLDEPFPFGAIHAGTGRSGEAVVRQAIVRTQPDLASPGACPDHFAKSQPPEPLGEGFAVRGGVLIAEHHHVAAEGILHVPLGAVVA